MKTLQQLRNNLSEKHLTPAELKKREEIAQAIERENPGMDKSKKMAIATTQAKKVAEDVDQIDELNWKTLNRYASKAKSVGMQGGDKAAKHLAGSQRAKEKLKYGDYSEEAEQVGDQLQEGEDAQKRFQDYHNDTAKLMKGIHKALADHYEMHHKTAHWGHVGDVRHLHDQLRDIHDRMTEQGEYAKAAEQERKAYAHRLGN